MLTRLSFVHQFHPDLLVELQDFIEAANVLSGYRFDADVRADIYVQIAECFLHEIKLSKKAQFAASTKLFSIRTTQTT